VFVAVERRTAARGGDPLLNLSVLRAPGLASGLAAVTILMVTYGAFLFSLALQLQGDLRESALRAGLTFAPCAVAFGICGFFWRRLPERIHHLLTPGGCLVAVAAYAAVGLDLASGTRGGPQLQVTLIVLGASLALGFSPLVTHSLMHVPLRDAADASGLFTTTLQLGQAVGVATFGSVFLTLAAEGRPHASAHALATTLYWLALLLALGAAAAIPLTRTTSRARTGAYAAAGAGTPATRRVPPR
jgi:cytochrome bd-type quinol oxidase subunit 2